METIKKQLEEAISNMNTLLSHSCIKIKQLSFTVNGDHIISDFGLYVEDEYLLTESHPIKLNKEKFKHLIQNVFVANRLDSRKITYDDKFHVFSYMTQMNYAN